jgi:hypothetical protein
LGDDIVIFSKKARDKYYTLITNLGIEISILKSVISEPGTPLLCEFAAKIFKDQCNVGHFPIGAIFHGGRYDLFTIWTALRERVPLLREIPDGCFEQNLIHGPDLGTAFPLSKDKVYAELSTL